MSFLRELWEKLKGKGPAAAVALSLDLGEARENKPYSIEAGGLIVETCSGDLYARVNGPNGDGVNLRYVHRLSYPFSCLYLTNTAQPGFSARLILLPLGLEAESSDVSSRLNNLRAPFTTQNVAANVRFPSDTGVPAGKIYEVYVRSPTAVIYLSGSSDLLGPSSSFWQPFFPAITAYFDPNLGAEVMYEKTSTCPRGWTLTQGEYVLCAAAYKVRWRDIT